MTRAAVLWFGAITLPMAAALLYEHLHGTGNHWFLFGTLPDRIIQRSGYLAAALLPLSLASLAAGALWRGAPREALAAGSLTAICAAIAFAFVPMALD